MAWSDAARKAAAEARKRNRRTRIPDAIARRELVLTSNFGETTKVIGWSETARKAAAEARRRNALGGKRTRVEAVAFHKEMRQFFTPESVKRSGLFAGAYGAQARGEYARHLRAIIRRRGAKGAMGLSGNDQAIIAGAARATALRNRARWEDQMPRPQLSIRVISSKKGR